MRRMIATRSIIALALLLASGVTSTVAAQRGTGGRGARMGGRAAARGGGSSADRDIRDLLARIQTRDYLFADTNERLEYKVYVSTRVKADKPSPLVIALHGLGTEPERILRMIGQEAEKGGYIVAAPTGYNLQGWYGANGLTSERTRPANLGELSEKDVMNVLDLMLKEHNIDSSRVYLVGQSMGGAGALHLGIKYAHIWAAVAASAPALRPQQQPDQLAAAKQVPMILVHGDIDRAVPVEQSRIWAAKMKELKMTHEYYEIGGAGHDALTGRGAERVFQFLKKHKKAR